MGNGNRQRPNGGCKNESGRPMEVLESAYLATRAPAVSGTSSAPSWSEQDANERGDVAQSTAPQITPPVVSSVPFDLKPFLSEPMVTPPDFSILGNQLGDYNARMAREGQPNPERRYYGGRYQ